MAKFTHKELIKGYTDLMQALAQRYPQATNIRVEQDNLNTHTTASFYKILPAEQAFRLAQRFEFYYIPKVPVG